MYFFYFLICISLFTILVTASCVRLLVLQYERMDSYTPSPLDVMPPALRKLWMAVMSMPIVVIFGLFTLLCAWSLTSLLLFHALIITVAQTTNERVRNVYQHYQNDAHGGCWQNWKTCPLYESSCRVVVTKRLFPSRHVSVLCTRTRVEQSIAVMVIRNSYKVTMTTSMIPPFSKMNFQSIVKSMDPREDATHVV